MKKLDVKIIIILILLVVVVLLLLGNYNIGRYEIASDGRTTQYFCIIDTKTGEVKVVSDCNKNQYGIKFKDMKLQP